MSWFRVPARSLFLASVGTAVLAGFGVQALQERLERADQWRRFAVRLGRIGILVIGVLLLLNRLSAPAPEHGRPETIRPHPERRSDGESVACLSCPSSRRRPRMSNASGVPPGESSRTRPSGRRRRCSAWWSAWDSSTDRRPIRGHAVHLLGLLALGELAWHGFALIQVAPPESVVRPDPISESLILLDPALTEREPFRVRARDAFYLDLDAARYEIEKTNINDVFQLGHAAALYETLYPVATRSPRVPDAPMSQAVDDHRRQIRQGVFDRMAVAYLVSDRVEADPPWPVAATGNRDGKTLRDPAEPDRHAPRLRGSPSRGHRR